MTNPVPTEVLRVGDTVTVQFSEGGASRKPEDIVTVSGRLRMNSAGETTLGPYIVAHALGNPGPDVICVIEHLPAEPPLGRVRVDEEGDYWVRLPAGWCLVPNSAIEGAYSWEKLNKCYNLEDVDA